jgi:pilus assembly protein CpaE
MRHRTHASARALQAPPLSLLPDDGQAASPARVDYELLRSLELESDHSPNGVFKLHPLATRFTHTGASSGAPSEASSEDERSDHEVTPAEPTSAGGRIVSLVSLLTGDAVEDPDTGPHGSNLRDQDDEADDGSPFAAGSPLRVPKVLVVDRAGKLSADLGKAAQGLVPEPKLLKLGRPTQVVLVAEREDPDVIVFSPLEVTAAGLKRLAQIHKAQPRVLILLSDNDKTWSSAQMAASGASDFLPINPSRARIRSKLVAALRTAEQLRSQSIVVTERIVVQDAAPPAPDPKTARSAADVARVFTVASASGGSGKTLVAINLAAYLVRATGGKVLLIDLDLQFGEVAPSLHLHPERTIEDLMNDPDELSATLVGHACGFKALCAPSDPLAAERIGPKQISAIFEVARREFDFIVVDTPPTLNETCLVAFDQSERLLITANMDVPSLKNMRRFLETIEKLDVPASQSVLVINRVDSGIGIDLKGVAQLFPQGFLAVLPVAKEVPWSINMGSPMLMDNPKAEISRRLADGFMKLVPPPTGMALPWAPPAQTARRAGILGIKRGKS